MIEIHAQVIDTFQDGKMRVLFVTEPGATQIVGKEGLVDIPYKVGDVLLAGPGDRIICGPVGFEGAVELSERVLSGDSRALTDPAALQMLATVVVALSSAAPPEHPLSRKAVAHG